MNLDGFIDIIYVIRFTSFLILFNFVIIVMEKEVHAHVINIPKQRVFSDVPKKVLTNSNKRSFKPSTRFRKPSEVSLQKYSLPGDKPLRVEQSGNDELMLSFKQYAKKQHSIRHTQQLLIKACDQYKIISTDLKRRLHVEEPPNEVQTITDVDEDFFNFVNGRLISRRPTYFKSLSHFFNYTLRKKIEIGYRKDTVMSIDAAHTRELHKYEKTIRKNKEQIKYLDQFISDDYHKSMEFLSKWEILKQKVIDKNLERQIFATRIFSITSILVGLNYMFSNQQKYGRFLYYISPPAWRAQNREFAQSMEIEHTGFDIGFSNDEDTATVMFEKLQSQCASNTINPVLYFKNPAEIIKVFDGIEEQLQYNFAHVISMAPILKVMNDGVIMYKDMAAKDTEFVASSIKGFSTLIDFYYERSKYLEQKFMSILSGLFYESVAAPDVLKLTLHLEFCYEQIYDEKLLNTDVVALAKSLEEFFLDYVLRVENLQGDEVKQAIRKCHQEDKTKMKRSKEAARELRLFARLEHELLIACNLPVKTDKYFTPLQTVKRGNERKTRKSKQPQDPLAMKIKSLTESELEYLRLFTDWTVNEDPDIYLPSNKEQLSDLLS